MKKRGQIAMYILLGFVILIAALFLSYIKIHSANAKYQPSVEKTGKAAFETEPIKSYIEACLKDSSEAAIFRAGMQGGLISTSGRELTKYYDRGFSEFYTGTGRASIFYNAYELPYYLDGDYVSIVPLEQIEKKSARYIFVEFLECADFRNFEDIGYSVITPNTKNLLPHLKNDFINSNFGVKVNINKNDITVNLNYPISITKGSLKSDMSNFLVTLPIGLGSIYENSNKLITNIKNNGQPPAEYNIPSDCSLYNTNGKTNVYYKPLTKDSGIIQLVDFSTYYEYYLKSFIFQFAVKNVNVRGNCAG